MKAFLTTLLLLFAYSAVAAPSCQKDFAKAVRDRQRVLVLFQKGLITASERDMLLAVNTRAMESAELPCKGLQRPSHEFCRRQRQQVAGKKVKITRAYLEQQIDSVEREKRLATNSIESRRVAVHCGRSI